MTSFPITKRAIVIDKNIPKPIGRMRHNYPFEQMEIGDSFLAPEHDGKKVGIAMYAHSKLTGKKFTRRTLPEGVRCWRIK